MPSGIVETSRYLVANYPDWETRKNHMLMIAEAVVDLEEAIVLERYRRGAQDYAGKTRK